MKKTITKCMLAIIIATSFSSCATIFGGKITQAQRTAPKAGEPKRAVRAVPLIADIVLFLPGLAVDFITGAIYKPEGNGTTTVDTKTESKTATTQQ
jgi:hypothetical protein